jgi:hypothetical protein
MATIPVIEVQWRNRKAIDSLGVSNSLPSSNCIISWAKGVETIRQNGGPYCLTHWGTEQDEASDVQDYGSPKASLKLGLRGFVAQELLSK